MRNAWKKRRDTAKRLAIATSDASGLRTGRINKVTEKHNVGNVWKASTSVAGMSHADKAGFNPAPIPKYARGKAVSVKRREGYVTSGKLGDTMPHPGSITTHNHNAKQAGTANREFVAREKHSAVMSQMATIAKG